ncbi:hypothetical protein UJ101_01370 [Flavobacteriaceae bacterium UJ101]|nr:hypothetical protein UJ101_01370 [Flavobacteriaceae bacterium UJ101]
MKPIDRVKIIINKNRLSISAFEKKVGLSNNTIQIALKRGSNLKDETLNSILNVFPDINPTWLLTGRGNMFLELDFTSEPDSNYPSLDEEKIQYVIDRFESCKKHPVLGKLIELEKQLAVKESLSQILVKKGITPEDL